METEHRQNGRRRINHPMVYTALDREGTILAQGVGQALDVSPNGIMVETREPIREQRLRIRITTPDGKSIAIDGILVYSILHGPEIYRTGIKLAGPEEAVSKFLDELQQEKSAVP